MANVLIQLKRGKQETWEKQNPTLAYGEPGYEKETGKLKIGNGITAWNELPYLTNGGESENIDFKQSDWSQNDENASDYIKNRTHGIVPNKDYFHITQEMIENPLENHSYPNNGEYYYKLLDIELDPIVDNLVGTTIFSIDEEGNEITEIININNIYDNRPDGDISVEICGNEIDLWIVTEDFDMEIYIDEETTETLSVTKGIWMIAYAEELKVKDIEVPCEVANRLDEKYLPKTIVGKNVEGKTFIIEDEEIVAQKGAEIFNDYLNNKATGYSSHAEGENTTASGHYSHAEGHNTRASGSYSHAEGHNTRASGSYSHAEGNYTRASGHCSHAEGENTGANGDYSHAEGHNTRANGDYQHVQGKYNIADETSAFIIGNGENENNRSNAMTVDWNGNAQFAGVVEANRIILKSSTSDKRFVITVDGNGTLTATEFIPEE